MRISSILSDHSRKRKVLGGERRIAGRLEPSENPARLLWTLQFAKSARVLVAGLKVVRAGLPGFLQLRTGLGVFSQVIECDP